MDDGYFGSYGSPEIHRIMLSDRARTGAYCNAIEGNAALFRDKVVLDVGCGTGILSLFAARAGARRVYAVDASDIIDAGRRIVERNGFANTVQLLKGQIEHVDLPERVDVIVSEWMGYGLLYENMLDSVLYARDSLLKPDGLMAPSTASLFLFGAEGQAPDEDEWLDFDFSALARHDAKYTSVATIEGSRRRTTTAKILELDLRSVERSELGLLQCNAGLRALRACAVNCLVLFFECSFPMAPGGRQVVLSTSPDTQETHWKQTLLWLDKPIGLRRDEGLTVYMSLVRGHQGNRGYTIQAVLHRDTDATRQQQTWYL